MSITVFTLAIAMALVSNSSPRRYTVHPNYGSHTYGSPIYDSLRYGIKTYGTPDYGSSNYGSSNHGCAKPDIPTNGRDVYDRDVYGRVMHHNGIDYYRRKVSFVYQIIIPPAQADHLWSK